MKLYSFGKSRSYKCVWLLKELGVEYENITVKLGDGEHYKDSFLKINPFGKVPALEDGDLVLHEASAILNYLADKYPEKEFIPTTGTKERAIFEKWSYFMANELECHLWAIEKNIWGYAEEKRSEQAKENAKDDFKKAIKIIDRELQTKNFLVSNRFSVADISLGYLLRWGRSHELLSDTQNLNQYLENLITRENYPHELFQKK